MQDKPRLLSHARQMRHAPTEAESMLWRHLRAGRLAAFKFKRQKPIGGFIVDFVCFAQKLVIEVDGGQHVEMQPRGEARTAWLQAQGFQVLRFWNHDVLQRRNQVLEEILRRLEAQKTRQDPPLPLWERSPRPRGGRGERSEDISDSFERSGSGRKSDGEQGQKPNPLPRRCAPCPLP